MNSENRIDWVVRATSPSCPATSRAELSSALFLASAWRSASAFMKVVRQVAAQDR